MVAGELVDVSTLSEEEYQIVLHEREYFLRYSELDRVHQVNRDSGRMDDLEEKKDELGERMPAPADYPKVPRKTRRGSNYFRTLSVMSPEEKELELLKPFRRIPGFEREKLGPRTRVLLFQCKQILEETTNAWKGEGPRLFPSNPDRRQIGWDKELGVSFT